MPTPERSPAVYQQIADHIRQQIAAGQLHPGDEVTSERQLAADWNVARPTAARALELLRNDGVIESRRGARSYVRETRAREELRVLVRQLSDNQVPAAVDAVRRILAQVP
ncbi:GntR family transcriptional regulator [Cryptosporangium sp. NPDC048952]|uniref:GntR family transcriptional regulator n=1 Tax=Cryptosporangium sp. NPDC048952 TaxID=3363961 RepID=UPI003713C586